MTGSGTGNFISTCTFERPNPLPTGDDVAPGVLFITKGDLPPNPAVPGGPSISSSISCNVLGRPPGPVPNTALRTLVAKRPTCTPRSYSILLLAQDLNSLSLGTTPLFSSLALANNSFASAGDNTSPVRCSYNSVSSSSVVARASMFLAVRD